MSKNGTSTSSDNTTTATAAGIASATTTTTSSSNVKYDNNKAAAVDSIFQMGNGIHTLQISVRDLFVANRQKVIREVVQEQQLRCRQQQANKSTTIPPTPPTTAIDIVIYIQGGTTQYRYDTDHEPIFRQESYFYYMCGVKEPDCAMSIHIHIPTPKTMGAPSTSKNTINNDTDDDDPLRPMDEYTSKTRLYVPNLPAEYATVMGPIRTKQEWKDMYLVDDVQYYYTTNPNNDTSNDDDDDDTCTTVEQYLLSDLFDRLENIVDDKSLVGVQEDEEEVTRDTGGIKNSGNKIVMVMSGPNSDSGNSYETPKLNYNMLLNSSSNSAATTSAVVVTVDEITLFPILAECRVIKSPTELYLLRYVTEVTSFGHTYVLRNIVTQSKKTNNTGDADYAAAAVMYEYQGESLFRHYCYYNYGCRTVGYTPICGCGPNSAILHYGHAGRPNSDVVSSSTTNNSNTICLFDMGIEYYHYGSDVTCSFPSNGVFTTKQQNIYQGVLNAQVAVYQMMKPGVSWVDCHTTAEATILSALVDIGIVVLSPTASSLSSSSDSNDTTTTTAEVATMSKTVDELVEMRMGAVFMPHGLGHFIGLDTHDVGGYLPGHPPRMEQPGLRKLRTARILQPNMVLTVEPGCYFIDHLLDEAMGRNSILRPYLNCDLINKEYRNFGGIRLEDVIQVTNDGIINYTLCPRSIHEVQGVASGMMKWPPIHDTAPELRRLRLTDTNPLPCYECCCYSK